MGGEFVAAFPHQLPRVPLKGQKTLTGTAPVYDHQIIRN